MLDSKQRTRSIDSKDMLGTIEHMPKHLTEGMRRGRMSGLPRFVPRNILVCGMGGSSIGGDLLCAWLSANTEILSEVCRSYHLPQHVGKDSLAIVASYSGNTEETIAMFEEARRKRAKVVVVSSGGQLAEMSKTYEVPFARLPTGFVPRASLGYMFGAMLGIVERSGFVDASKQVEEAARVLGGVISSCKKSVPTADNPAKKLAHELFASVPVVFGYSLSRPVAKRWANQLNENSKSMAYASELPEMNHNEIVGWMKDARSRGFAGVLLQHDLHDAAMSRRLDATRNMISSVAPVHTVKACGLSPMARMFSLVAVGDLVSVYLAILREQDPSDSGPIEDLKSVLSEK